MRIVTAAILFTTLLVLGATGAGGDEGFWRPERAPLALLAERHGFVPDPGFFDRIAAATLNFGDGAGCAVLVSSEGLVATSHHLVRERIAALGQKGKVLLDQGFLALRRDREIPLPGMRIESLVGSLDISARLDEAMKARLKEEGVDRELARSGAVQDLVDAESTRTGLLCRVSIPEAAPSEAVLQRFEVYEDVRLVFVPELDIATFGGDRDNFHFPRFWLDIAFLRIYRDGKPLATPNHLSFDLDGAEPGEFVVLAGHPDRAGRLAPPALARHSLEYFHPSAIRLCDGMIATLRSFAERGPGEAQRVAGDLASLANARKSFAGRVDAMLARGGLEHMENRWRSCFESASTSESMDPAMRADASAIGKWTERLMALVKSEEGRRHRRLFSRLESRSLARAKQMLAYARMQGEFEEGDPRLDEQRAALLSDIGSDAELEPLVAAARLELARSELGPEDAFVAACSAVAGEAGLVGVYARTEIGDLAFRSRLVSAGPVAMAACTDPMIELARRLEPIWEELWGPESHARDLEIEALERQISETAARFRLPQFGPEPDGSLRVSFGEVRGFSRGGSDVAAVTNVWGLFARHRAMRGQAPFVLPKSFLDARDRLDFDRNLNFAITADAGPGSSGGPVISREGRVLGLLFDVNYENLGEYFVYRGDAGRGIAIDASFVLEALRRVYDAHALADELVGERSFK